MLATSPVSDLVRQQREFFATGTTKDVAFRIDRLKRLKQAILDRQEQFVEALQADLSKPEFEIYATEIIVTREIDFALKRLKSWVKPQKVRTPLEQFPASARIYPEPLGCTLIIGPWNYPLQLTIAPLVGAMAAGNCTIVKPSEIAPHASKAIADSIRETFDPSYLAAVEGGVETSQQLLAEKFDRIFFTGGTRIGRIVMEAAAKHLTPVTLELGGKNPCIVDADVNIDRAAKRITWGKFLNAGQTCISPDYLLVDRRIKADLVSAICNCIREFYGEDPSNSPDLSRMASDRHFERVAGLLDGANIITGGQTNAEDRYIAPTLVDGVDWDSPVMQDEIFGPILPVLDYSDLSKAIAKINERPKPLALYLFSRDDAKQQRILTETSSGGVCINDTVIQVGMSELPFGGVGESGIGQYHGKASFDTFSHHKSVVDKPFWLDPDWRYAPYADKLKLVKRLFS